ncbi:hypothetical protein DICSQDRAFT_169442 [Dichomitus squalens LYAD-421 SS1]|uniref:FMN hydroxy acid dehydrogenase domain-containing protein n=1 Tax=Dichomitus squalens (strain LYAD-421) TaxID=732165 RepID=R7T257_DICSQ|nr:uncharacterized protein DICSQDRAFT_169442 [Dichomitus squalens LYAD-421 SS1]EJF62403.1 hypothetical protein DICSQDRAFT_169442 [Dichomitus squalens LYAD-421 SS1]
MTVPAEMTIIFDSGIRTGADVFKAIALGAHVVMIGRLFVWGMSHEGVHGCRHVIKSLLADLDILMTVAGYRSITEDVYKNKEALRYSPSGVPPGPAEHARL